MTTRSMLTSALLVAVAAAPAALAQQPAPMPGVRDSMHREMGQDRRTVRIRTMDPMMGAGMLGGGMMAEPKGGIAAMLLGQTAALRLTDQQVTRLAALARSAEAQQSAVRASMDSVHKTMMARMASGGTMPMMTPELEARMTSVHDQMHVNVRDALAVLTPDQLATAWEEMHGGMGGMRMMMRGMGDGMGAGMGPGMQHEERVIIERP